MPYVTVRRVQGTHQITLDDIIYGRAVFAAPVPKRISNGDTVTHFVVNGETLTKHLNRYNIQQLIQILEEFNASHANLFEKDRKSLYRTFHIPKRTGGFRTINEPCPELMEALRQLKYIFEDNFGALHHTSAFAYVAGRCTVDAVKRHQRNRSHWFLKTDFSDFFGSTNEEFTINMISKIFPFSEVAKYPNGMAALRRALDLAFLDGGLPQGTPLSPTLTNIVMIPIDHALSNSLIERKFVYTRYADDILISRRESFDPKEICRDIESTLERFGAPFRIKDKKTRYGSSAGKNWNLGVMLNKDNEITIGRKNKEFLKAACNNYIRDKKKHVRWEPHDVMVLTGKISYFRMVEPEYVAGFIKWFNEKNNVNLMKMLRDELR